MEFCKRIRKKRKAMGFNQTKLAELVGCSSSFICKIESGLVPKRMGRGVIARLKKVLKVRTRGAASKPRLAPPPCPRSPARSPAPAQGRGAHPQVPGLAARAPRPHRVLAQASGAPRGREGGGLI